ncbi:biotin--[acetyl-CoA-carboxylase] ligase [Dechloromonas sp. H13]|uniref:biotin--[acetyl-CoA-carboxylase] ligase n=1 Tax=Dechloromonas sp. H13 TaxID=2570193 RepID=UPI0012921056|nr:biotin--[acetyl-CoA-carboxylase] ligase [Dechloromonas sp. H13]
MTLIDPALLKIRLGALAGRFDVDALAECDSTSSELLRRAERGAPAGTVVVADRQHAGRGRRGRQWLSAPGDSLTFSCLWRFTGPATQLAGLSLAVGVAVSEALEGLGARRVRLKWPNDVLLEQGGDYAKLAGILVELASDRRGTQAVIGIGINLRAPAGDLPQPAAGLADDLPALPDRHDLLAALLGALAGALDRFEGGGFAALQSAWQRRHAWQNQPVRLLQDGVVDGEGICLGADTDGALLVETPVCIKRFLSGDVSLRRA